MSRKIYYTDEIEALMDKAFSMKVDDTIDCASWSPEKKITTIEGLTLMKNAVLNLLEEADKEDK